MIGNASEARRGLSLLSFLPLRERPLLAGNFDVSMQLVGIFNNAKFFRNNRLLYSKKFGNALLLVYNGAIFGIQRVDLFAARLLQIRPSYPSCYAREVRR